MSQDMPSLKKVLEALEEAVKALGEAKSRINDPDLCKQIEDFSSAAKSLQKLED